MMCQVGAPRKSGAGGADAQARMGIRIAAEHLFRVDKRLFILVEEEASVSEPRKSGTTGWAGVEAVGAVKLLRCNRGAA